MRRWALRICVFLLVGAIVNVAVAWVAPYVFGEKHQVGVPATGQTWYQWDVRDGTRRGWPMSTLATELTDSTGSWGTAIEIDSDDSSTIELGLWPIWPGFAINTVFYAAILWLLFAAPLALRRRRRFRRGLCPKCAYDLRGTPVVTACPECGTLTGRADPKCPTLQT